MNYISNYFLYKFKENLQNSNKNKLVHLIIIQITVIFSIFRANGGKDMQRLLKNKNNPNILINAFYKYTMYMYNINQYIVIYTVAQESKSPTLRRSSVDVTE